MARVKKAVGDLRARIANCSVKAAFALYAAIAIIAAIALTAIFSVVAPPRRGEHGRGGLRRVLGDLRFRRSFELPRSRRDAVVVRGPPAFESLYGQDGTEAPEGESAGTGAVILYVEGSSRADSKLCFVNSF